MIAEIESVMEPISRAIATRLVSLASEERHPSARADEIDEKDEKIDRLKAEVTELRKLREDAEDILSGVCRPVAPKS